MKRLYFIRHALSELNKSGHMAGTTDTPLTDEGRQQAKAAAQKIKNLDIDMVVSSPLSRALETAQIIAREISYPEDKILTNKLLIERDFGSLEGKPWSPDLNLDGFADIETEDTIVERAHLAFKWMQSLDCVNILVVSHGTFGRALRSILKEEYTMNHHDRLNNAELNQWL